MEFGREEGGGGWEAAEITEGWQRQENGVIAPSQITFARGHCFPIYFCPLSLIIMLLWLLFPFYRWRETVAKRLALATEPRTQPRQAPGLRGECQS